MDGRTPTELAAHTCPIHLHGRPLPLGVRKEIEGDTRFQRSHFAPSFLMIVYLTNE